MELPIYSLIATLPLFMGIIILKMIDNKRLAFALFQLFLFVSLWQFDVSLLFTYQILPIEIMDILFRLFRIGPIMLTPTLMYIAYTIASLSLKDKDNIRWTIIINKYVVIAFYLLGLITYVVGWTKHGIAEYTIIHSEKFSNFYFPVYGSLSWVFIANVSLFLVGALSCVVIAWKLNNSEYKSFLVAFMVLALLGYGIGRLNFYPESRLYYSGVAILFFATTVFILSLRFNMNMIKKVNQQLDTHKNFLQTVIDHNPNFIYAVNQEGVFTLVNKSFAELYGSNPQAIIGKTINTIQPNQSLISNEDIYDVDTLHLFEEKFIQVDGQKKWVNSYKIPIKKSEDILLLGVATDITALKEQETKIRKMAYLDDLTKLPNRRLFNNDLELLINNEHNQSKIGVFFIDFDRFKFVNDTLGHDIGDQLLIQLGSRLQKLVVDNKVKVYRIGGDEFTIIYADCDYRSVEVLAKTILDIFNQPIQVDNNSLYITPSIGISVYPDDGLDTKTIIKNADAAMYHIKETGKNNYQFFNAGIDHYLQRKLAVEKQLRSAIENDELTLYYQPQLDLQTMKVAGVEALIRWDNKELGTVSPAEFIPIAEETNLIKTLGEWVLTEACRQNKQWQNAGFNKIKVAVNISIKQFNEADFVDTVAKVLAATNLEATYLELEITEGIAISDPQIAINKLHQLKELGVTISIDDFGTGYSSLSYLQKYPIDLIKIDQSFLKGILTNKENTAIVVTILSMAQHLNLDVIAEGVETESEFQYLLSTSCNLAQGYYIGHPQSADEIQKEFNKSFKKLQTRELNL
nr:EAL domain-containing protein [Paenibacillus bovis]